MLRGQYHHLRLMFCRITRAKGLWMIYYTENFNFSNIGQFFNIPSIIRRSFFYSNKPFLKVLWQIATVNKLTASLISFSQNSFNESTLKTPKKNYMQISYLRTCLWWRSILRFAGTSDAGAENAKCVIKQNGWIHNTFANDYVAEAATGWISLAIQSPKSLKGSESYI